MRWRSIILLGLVAIVAGVAWALTEQSQRRHDQTNIQQAQTSDISKKRQPLLRRFVIWIRNITATTWTAVATLLLVAVTGLLVWVAAEQSITVRGQTRAYVFIKGGSVQLNDTATAVAAAVEVENTGQTPGYDFETWTGIRIGQPDDDPFGELGEPVQRSIIGPRTNHGVPSGWVPISNAQINAVSNGQLVIFVWGYARYKDVFGRRWEFVFRSRNGQEQVRNIIGTNGQLLGVGWGLMPHTRGYSETQK